MWNRQRHCSDDQLLAHADGELAIIPSAWVRKHLNVCWDCRRRLSELEAQTHLLAKALRDDALLSPARASQAKARFLDWRRSFEERFAETSPRFSRRRFSLRNGALVGAGACAIVLTVFSIAWLKRVPPSPEPSEILARTQTAESKLYENPLLVHQTFQVRMRQIKPEQRARAGQIEIWSDSDGRRFASRWRDGGGALRHAVWRSGRGHDYLYNPAVAPGVVEETRKSSIPLRTLGDWAAGAVDVDKLETELMQWIENRQWRPIALSSDFNAFASQDGSVLRAQREGARICLQAERVNGALRIEFSLELEMGSYKPLLQRIRFESSGRVMELELAAGECEFVSAARLTPGVFEPERSLIPARYNPALRQPVVPDTEPGHESPPSAASLAALEIEVRYALHRLRACMGEPIEVAQVSRKAEGGYLEVRGLVESEERKSELLSALAELASVKVTIRTAEEALKEATPKLQPVDPVPVTSREDVLRLSSRSSPIQQELKVLLAGGQGIAAFSTQAISLSQGALLHAWALRRLVERYDRDAEIGSLPRSRWLLEIMARDHKVALETGNRRARALLEPVLKQVRDKFNLQPGPAPVLENRTNPDWRRVTLDAFETTNEIDKLVRGLFAGAELFQIDGSGHSGTLDAKMAQEYVHGLIDAFQRLEFQLSDIPLRDSGDGF